jgi:hypothetical protein
MYSSYHTISSRPIKIAILVEYGDKKNLERAILINSSLWGGGFNPIIPVYKRIPSKYKGLSGYKTNSGHGITKGYLDAYDADYMINLTTFSDKAFGLPERRVIAEKDIFEVSAVKGKTGYQGEINYGIGLYEILDYFENEEFKYERKIPLDVVDIQFGKRNSLFFASVYGNYAENTRKNLQSRYAKTIAIQKKQIKMSNYLEVWDSHPTTVRQICNSYFAIFGNSSPTDSYIFLMDSGSWQDIVDFISLKAAGFRILPMPIELCASNEAILLSKKFITKNYRKYNDNGVYYRTNILRSRDCDEAIFRSFAGSVTVQPQEPGQFMAVQQDWFPRIWESWGRESDEANVVRLEHSQESHDISGTNNIKIPQLIPDIIESKDMWWYKPKFVNDISIGTYGETDYIANVFPANIERADMVLGRPGLDEWRFSKNGITYTASHPRGDISYTLPEAEKVYEAWQKAHGVTAQISNPGKLAQQIVRKLGVDHLDLLAFEDFAKLIQRLTGTKGNVNSIPAKTIKEAIRRFTADTIWYDAEGFLKWILHKGIFELGADVKCENCGQESWHKLKALDTRLTCNICFETIDVGESEPNKAITWAYRPIGPFSVPDLAMGAYTVVLALHFFAEVMNMKITPRYSFESKDGAYEADFGALVAPTWREGNGNGILQLIGECKSFGLEGKPQFAPKDIAKLEKLASISDNSVIVFATLARELNATDKRMLKKFALRLRSLRLKKGNVPDLLILTGNELFTHRDLADSWNKLTEKHKSFASNVSYGSTRNLCDLTQQIYLNMESLQEFQERAFNIKRETTETTAS